MKTPEINEALDRITTASPIKTVVSTVSLIFCPLYNVMYNKGENIGLVFDFIITLEDSHIGVLVEFKVAIAYDDISVGTKLFKFNDPIVVDESLLSTSSKVLSIPELIIRNNE
jgi:hypothetical protein